MTYQMITTVEGLEEVLDIVGDGVAALDFETLDGGDHLVGHRGL